MKPRPAPSHLIWPLVNASAKLPARSLDGSSHRGRLAVRGLPNAPGLAVQDFVRIGRTQLSRPSTCVAGYLYGACNPISACIPRADRVGVCVCWLMAQTVG